MLSKRCGVLVATFGMAVALGFGAAGRTQTAGAPPPSPPAPAAKAEKDCDHFYWVQQSFDRMKTIRVGMTRRQLLAVFTTPGGSHLVPPETFAYRGCPWFQVEVEFKPMGKPVRDQDGEMRVPSDPQDIIVKISRPFVAENWYRLVPEDELKRIK